MKATANIMRLCLEAFDGEVPAVQDRARFAGFIQGRCKEVGSTSEVRALLAPNRDAFGAVLTLYLLASGSNVAVGTSLLENCFEISDLDGHVRVTGHKDRADGKPIIVDLPEDCSAVKGLRWIREATKSYRHKAGADREFLLLEFFRSKYSKVSGSWYRFWFKEMISSSEVINDLKLLPSMIRPSVLLKACLDSDGRLLAGLAIGQHGVAIGQGYQQKWPIRAAYDAGVRRFQTYFSDIVIGGVPEAARRLGLQIEGDATYAGKIASTGFGVLCTDPRGRAGIEGEACKTGDCWNSCPNMLLVAEVDAIAELQIWQRSLRDAQGDWERDRSERWEKVWLPWLCLVDVVEEKMARGHLLLIWDLARTKVESLMKQPGFQAPQPW